MGRAMKLSVVICTWNRSALLDQTLAGMQQLKSPDPGDWELLVVNNRCTDDTDEVIARYADRLPVRRIYEPQPGQCHARNAGIDHAVGDLVIWTDDDVLVNPDWLLGYAQAAQRWPQAAYFGGPIRPWYEVEPPRWLTENLDLLKGMLVIRDLGAEESPLGIGDQPFGANMAFRRSVLQRWRFDTRLGLVGDSAIRGDETGLFQQLRAAGEMGVWIPSASVRHLIPASRMTRHYLRQWAHGWGRTTVRMRQQSGNRRSPARWRLRANRWRWTVKSLMQSAVGSPRWARSEYKAAELQGMLDELAAQRRE